MNSQDWEKTINYIVFWILKDSCITKLYAIEDKINNSNSNETKQEIHVTYSSTRYTQTLNRVPTHILNMNGYTITVCVYHTWLFTTAETCVLPIN